MPASGGVALDGLWLAGQLQFGLPKSSAFRRSEVARLIARFPAIEAPFLGGWLSLRALVELRDVCRAIPIPIPLCLAVSGAAEAAKSVPTGDHAAPRRWVTDSDAGPRERSSSTAYNLMKAERNLGRALLSKIRRRPPPNAPRPGPDRLFPDEAAPCLPAMAPGKSTRLQLRASPESSKRSFSDRHWG